MSSYESSSRYKRDPDRRDRNGHDSNRRGDKRSHSPGRHSKSRSVHRVKSEVKSSRSSRSRLSPVSEFLDGPLLKKIKIEKPGETEKHKNIDAHRNEREKPQKDKKIPERSFDKNKSSRSSGSRFSPVSEFLDGPLLKKIKIEKPHEPEKHKNIDAHRNEREKPQKDKKIPERSFDKNKSSRSSRSRFSPVSEFLDGPLLKKIKIEKPGEPEKHKNIDAHRNEREKPQKDKKIPERSFDKNKSSRSSRSRFSPVSEFLDGPLLKKIKIEKPDEPEKHKNTDVHRNERKKPQKNKKTPERSLDKNPAVRAINDDKSMPLLKMIKTSYEKQLKGVAKLKHDIREKATAVETSLKGDLRKIEDAIETQKIAASMHRNEMKRKKKKKELRLKKAKRQKQRMKRKLKRQNKHKIKKPIVGESPL